MKIRIQQNPKIEVKSVNGVNIQSNPHEFIFTFRQDLPMHDEKEMFLNQNVIARYSITPAFAKILLGVLAKNVKTYEEKYGEIVTHVPEGLK